MDINKKTVLLSVAGAVVAAIIVQQIAYRNSMEFKLKEFFKQEQKRAESEEAKKCADYQQMKARNPQWVPLYADEYDSCK